MTTELIPEALEAAIAAHPCGSGIGCRVVNCEIDSLARQVDALLPRLRRYALRLTRDASAADDLVQEAIARGIEKIHLWQPGSDMRAWLFRILHNLHVSGIRRAAREKTAIASIHAEVSLFCRRRQIELLELRDLQRGLAKLPEKQRSVVLLIGLEGGRYESVARLLDIPVGTVRSRLSRGRASLRVLTDQESAPRSRRRQSPGRAAA